MDKYDEAAKSLNSRILAGRDRIQFFGAASYRIGPVEIIARALREAAADAYEDAARHIVRGVYSEDDVPVNWLAAKAASLRSGKESK